MKIPDDVFYILSKLEKMGFSAYVVGGCVRDSVMGITPKDWDVATSARPEQIKILFPKTYDTGIKHGTITVVFNERRFEVTTFRVDGEYRDFRRPDKVEYSLSIEEDLKRRDFTINAIAYNGRSGFVDPYGGINDISAQLIRGVGNPSERFREDALRMLRAVRFAASLGFCIEKDTADAVLENAPLIKNISAERIYVELTELLLAPNPLVVFSREFISLIEYVSKPLSKSISKNSQSLSRLIEDCKKDAAMRFAVLIYYLSLDDAKAFLKALKPSKKIFNRIINIHRVKDERVKTEYYDVARKVNEWGVQTFEDYLYMLMLNCIAGDGDLEYVLKIESHFRLITENRLPVFIRDLAVNGYDLNMEFKITGETTGKTLEHLLDYVCKYPYKNTYSDLLKEAYVFITA